MRRIILAFSRMVRFPASIKWHISCDKIGIFFNKIKRFKRYPILNFANFFDKVGETVPSEFSEFVPLN